MAQLTQPTPLIEELIERSHVAPSGGVRLIKAAYKRWRFRISAPSLESVSVKWSTSRKLTNVYNCVNTALSCVVQSLFYVVSNQELH